MSCFIVAKRLHHLQTCIFESVWLEIKRDNAALIVIGFIYRNPNEKTEGIDFFNSMRDAVLKCEEYMLLGDFNFDLLNPKITG